MAKEEPLPKKPATAMKSQPSGPARETTIPDILPRSNQNVLPGRAVHSKEGHETTALQVDAHASQEAERTSSAVMKPVVGAQPPFIRLWIIAGTASAIGKHSRPITSHAPARSTHRNPSRTVEVLPRCCKEWIRLHRPAQCIAGGCAASGCRRLLRRTGLGRGTRNSQFLRESGCGAPCPNQFVGPHADRAIERNRNLCARAFGRVGSAFSRCGNRRQRAGAPTFDAGCAARRRTRCPSKER